MRLYLKSLVFSFLLLLSFAANLQAAVWSNRYVMFQVSAVPTLTVSNETLNATSGTNIDAQPKVLPMSDVAEKQTKLLLAFLGMLLAMGALWSSIKVLLVSVNRMSVEGFTIKVMSGIVFFILSLLMLIYAVSVLAKGLGVDSGVTLWGLLK